MKMAFMKNPGRFFCPQLFCLSPLLVLTSTLFGQQDVARISAFSGLQLEAPLTSGQPADNQKERQNAVTPSGTPETESTREAIPASQQQPKRILGIMPNYRAVSAGAIPPPPTFKQS